MLLLHQTSSRCFLFDLKLSGTSAIIEIMSRIFLEKKHCSVSHFQVELYLLSEKEGGRSLAVHSGYTDKVFCSTWDQVCLCFYHLYSCV